MPFKSPDKTGEGLVSKPPSPMRFVGEDSKKELHATEEQFARVAAAIGSSGNFGLAKFLMPMLNLLRSDGEEESYLLNAAVEMIEAIAPRDGVEALLAQQMVANHLIALRQSRMAMVATTLDHMNAHGNLATKASRTYAAQLEALNRHRRGGKQVVEHVHVNAGGQAVIAQTVNTGGANGE